MNATEILATVARAESHRFVGRLGAEPEIKFFQSGSAVCNARMAISWPDAKRDEKDKTDWFKVELWNEDAQAFADGAHKGDLVEVIGRVKTERYQSRDGEAKVSLIVKPESWRVLRRSGEPAGPAPAPAAAAPVSSGNATAAAPATVWQSNTAIDEEIPF
jgi:single-strand DNA-binding protein